MWGRTTLTLTLTRIPERLLVAPALVALLLGLAVGAASAGGSPSTTVDPMVGVDGGGHAVVTGTYRCGSGSLSLRVVVAEGHPAYARGQAPLSLQCDDTTRAWSATVIPAAGSFRPRDGGTVTLQAPGVGARPTAVEYAVGL